MASRTKMAGFFATAVRASGKAAPAAGDVVAPAGLGVLPASVTIFAPARSPMQQGMSKVVEGGKAPVWRLAFSQAGGIGKWPNPMIGWTSTADALENMTRANNGFTFDTMEEAVGYCQRYGLKYSVKQAPPKTLGRPARFLQYGDNYSFKRKGYPEGGLRSLQG